MRNRAQDGVDVADLYQQLIKPGGDASYGKAIGMLNNDWLLSVVPLEQLLRAVRRYAPIAEARPELYRKEAASFFMTTNRDELDVYLSDAYKPPKPPRTDKTVADTHVREKVTRASPEDRQRYIEEYRKKTGRTR